MDLLKENVVSSENINKALGEKLVEAPESGTMYALYEDRVVYEKYTRSSLGDDIDKGLLELHLFDREKEFRCAKATRGYIITCVSDDNAKPDDIYEEVIYTKTPSDEDDDARKGSDNKVGVVNYIKYDDNDMITIPNYRLKEV